MRKASGKLCKIPENGFDKLYALRDRSDRNPGTFAVSGGLVNFHKYITHWFKNDPEKYILITAVTTTKRIGLYGRAAESPYKTWRLRRYLCELDSGGEHSDRKHYRAVHYIVVYRGVYIEIQIKTLFERAGEIDHSILYPQRKETPC